MDLDRHVDTDARRAAAAEWLQHLDDAGVSEAQIQSWLEWFGACDENCRAFEEMQTVYRRMRGMPGDYRAEIRQRVFGVAEERRSKRVGRRLVARPPVWATAAAMAGVAIAGALWWKTAGDPASFREAVMYAAPSDRHRTVELEDGTALALAADAIVAVSYTDAFRAVTIERGQTYFEVANDAARPFVVSAGELRLKAVGTAFNVVRGQQTITVTVIEGVVEVTRIAAGSTTYGPVRVSVGERRVIEVERSPPVVPPSAGDAIETMWRDGRIEFVGATLNEVLPLVNQYAPRRIVIDDPRVADLTYSGTILRDHVGEWIASLPRIYPVRSLALEDGTTTLVMGKNPE